MYSTEGIYEAKILPVWVVLSEDIVYKMTYNINANPLQTLKNAHVKHIRQEESHILQTTPDKACQNLPTHVDRVRLLTFRFFLRQWSRNR